jgi:N-acetylmuramoyl-L-alanine amidase
MKIAVCIGHSRSGDDGAVSADGRKTEWAFNQPIGARVVADLMRAGHEAVLVDKYWGAGYGAAMGWLAGHLRELGVEAAVELHFNASDNPKAEGHEWLHWHNSERGRALALCLEKSYARTMDTAKRRGVNALDRTSRGAEFVSRTHCPAVICEPFFGTNIFEWRKAEWQDYYIVSAITRGIINWAAEQ